MWTASWVVEHGGEGVGVQLYADRRTNMLHVEVSPNDQFVVDLKNKHIVSAMEKPFVAEIEGDIKSEDLPPITISVPTHIGALKLSLWYSLLEKCFTLKTNCVPVRLLHSPKVVAEMSKSLRLCYPITPVLPSL